MGRFRGRIGVRTLCLCAALVLTGLAGCAEGFAIAPLPEGGVAVTGWSGNAAEVTVPPEIDGAKVAAIGANAFAGCADLQRVALPEGLEALGDGAFADCRSLEEISVPASVARVGENPFAGCESLKKLALADGGPYLGMINGVLFGDGGRRLICCPRTLPMERYVAPEGTERIDPRAFSGCNRLLSVELPDSVTDIGADAFEGRANLTLIVGRGSFAERYARENGLKYNYTDAAEWLADDQSEEMGS